MADENTNQATEVPAQTALPTEQPKWWIDEGVPGVGDRPQWLPEKFKNIKDAVQSGLNLEKKLGTAPVNDYDFGEYANTFDKEHEAFKELTAFAKDKRVPQEVFTKMLESVKKYGESFAVDEKAEMAKMGPDAERRVEVLDNWAKSNLSDKAYNALTKSLRDAESVMAFEEVRAKMIGNNNPSIPNGSEQQAGATETVSDLGKELEANYQKYKTDENYRDDWKRRNAMATSRANGAGFVDKIGGRE